VITIGLDHYNDQASALAQAKQTSNSAILSVFSRARFLLLFNAILLVVALARSPPSTWLITAFFITPALLWDTPLFRRGSKNGAPRVKKTKAEKAGEAKDGFIIKRIPGMKAVRTCTDTWSPDAGHSPSYIPFSRAPSLPIAWHLARGHLRRSLCGPQSTGPAMP